MELSLFEIATKEDFQFESPRGLLNVQDLWNLKLTTGPANLNDIAKAIDAKLAATATKEFVPSAVRKTSAQERVLTLQLEVVKRIIAFKLEEREAAEAAQEKQAKRARLLEALATAEGRELTSKSVDELRTALAELDA